MPVRHAADGVGWIFLSVVQKTSVGLAAPACRPKDARIAKIPRRRLVLDGQECPSYQAELPC
ncbi:MAG: hypothetical protein JWM11_5143 [Planctomycetaceae bacterium]|nr:hypothetical protein [Planctomycetaceae bacterium]